MGVLKRLVVLSAAAAAISAVGPSSLLADADDLLAQKSAKKCTLGKNGKRVCKNRKRRSKADLFPPEAPLLLATSPTSPANDAWPEVIGSAEPGSTVRIYREPTCSALLATAGAAQLSTGLTITLTPNSYTNLYATATDAAGNTSHCSRPGLTYVEAPVAVDTDPALFPEFDPAISDYVTRCDGGTPLSVSVSAPHATLVGVDGSAPQQGDFTAPVDLGEGQGFSFSVETAEGEATYQVRCLPADFPAWTFERFSQPNNDFYVLEPNFLGTTRYAAVFDDYGVPVWWFEAGVQPIDGRVLSDGSIAWGRWGGQTGYEIHALDGSLQRVVKTTGASTDAHDIVEVGNGNFLLLEYRPRAHVDISACGGPSDTTVIDAVIQEVNPDGDLVWEWNSGDPGHLDLAESLGWCTTLGGPPYDIVHINSVELDGDSVIVSMRHTDSVYKIDRATGEIVWKLGGTATPESLHVLNDPYGAYPFGGQHDARRLADGTVTLYDDATPHAFGEHHQPRGVRYAIDEDARTATLLESVTDPDVLRATCCGSARRSSSGAWLINWGGWATKHQVSEFAPDGDRAFRMTFPGTFTYRAFPVPDGRLTRADLRAGMDAMHPRP